MALIVCTGRPPVTRQQFGLHRTTAASFSAAESTTQPDIGRMAAAIGDPIRIHMLLLLTEGRPLTVRELIYGAGVEPTTVSVHLRWSKADALITSLSNRYYKYPGLRSPAVMEMIKSLLVAVPEEPADLRRSVVPENLCVACLCHDHLAGQFGTEMSEKLLSRGWLTQLDETHGAYGVTPEGEQAPTAAGADVSALRDGRYRFVYDRMDWNERHSYLVDASGAVVVERYIVPGWPARRKHSRVLSMTEVGQHELHAWLRTTQGPTAACRSIPRIDLTQSRWDMHIHNAL